jgi:cardiolipin synthase
MSLSWLPNAVSIMRIVLVAPIVMLLLRAEFGWALMLFLIAAVSDGIDGYLAKHFSWHSRLGAILDPAGDKLLVAGNFATLAYLSEIPIWLAGIVILRDVVIVAGSFLVNFLVQPLSGEPTRISKLNTALELMFLLFVISRAGYAWPDKITITILGAAILVTVVISGSNYVATWVKQARRGGNE